jgi:uncharacterized protein (TIGR04168 family)
MSSIQIAVVGDVHRNFSDHDSRYFNASDYDLILLVGDLSNWWPREGLEAAHHISKLKKPTFCIPGNHDTINAFQLLAEVKKVRLVATWASLGQERHLEKLRKVIAPVTLGGYSVHPLNIAGSTFDLIAARPFSMGGDEFASRRVLRRIHGINSMSESVALLKRCVDNSNSGRIVFLAHNGPTGLGMRRDDIWGRDFEASGGDHGDPDLRSAIDYALETGKEVVAVVAGHMHRQIKGGGAREWWIKANGIHYINAAHVPRIAAHGDVFLHHHVRITFEESNLVAEDVFVHAAGV